MNNVLDNVTESKTFESKKAKKLILMLVITEKCLKKVSVRA